MEKFKHLILLFSIVFLFTGCVGSVLLAGSVVSAASTTQEVDEEYDGDLIEYIDDKLDALNRYLKKKSSN